MKGSFRGWYFRYQDSSGNDLALIPARHTGENGKSSASLQIITPDRTWWLDFPAESYSDHPSPFRVRLGDCIFDHRGCFLSIDHPELTLHGTLLHGPLTPIASDIMGPFSRLPCMECRHAIVSMYHSTEGQINLGGRLLDFSDGQGYIEGDKGSAFPKAYLWTQCLWQTPTPASLMLSVARVPVGPFSFTGIICAIRYEGQEYRMATYCGARVEHWSKAGAVIRQGRFLLTTEVLAEAPLPLRAPVAGRMRRVVHESLCTRMRYRLTQDDRIIFDHTDSRAAFEYAAGVQTF